MNLRIKSLALSVVLLLVLVESHAQATDTLYYDNNWKGVENKAFASFYRIISSSNDETQKCYKDFYITGEVQGEGRYISIDPHDDSLSVFDGEQTMYYKNGLVKTHVNLRKGKAEGIETNFTEDGSQCMQIELEDGKPKNGWYIVSDKNGFSSKISTIDDKPIWESPSIEEKKTEYKDGQAWPYYIKNGIVVGMSNTQIKDYGKWYQISLYVANQSMVPIDFDPELITSTLQKANGQEVSLEVWSSERYMRKVRRTNTWNMIGMGLAEGMAAAGAGYSTSTTNSTYNGYSNSYGNAYAYGSDGSSAIANYNGFGNFSGNSTSTTTSYNGAAAYQAQVIASNRLANYENSLNQDMNLKQEGYLRKTTIYGAGGFFRGCPLHSPN